MALALRVDPAHGRNDSGSNADLAAALLHINGHDQLWTARGLCGDPDVTTWALGALDAEHPDYASLFWSELERIRAGHA